MCVYFDNQLVFYLKRSSLARFIAIWKNALVKCEGLGVGEKLKSREKGERG